MTLRGPSSCFLLYDGYNISSDTFQLDDSTEEIQEQVNGLGTSFEEHAGVGVARTMLEASGGLYDDRVGGIVEALEERGAVPAVVLFGYATDAIGAVVRMLAGALVAKWKRIVSREGLTKAHAEYQVTGDARDGVVLHGIDAESADGNTESSPVDNGAGSADGAEAQLHLLALTLGGYTNVVVSVVDSPDDMTYMPLVAFDAMTAPGAQRKTVVGAVGRYLAAAWAFTGSGSGPSVVPVVAVARN